MPPTGWPVASRASSALNMRGLPPNTARAFLLSSRAVPQVTTSSTLSPTRSERVFAISAGVTPNASAASVTVAELCPIQ
jgi:hypothetical protein